MPRIGSRVALTAAASQRMMLGAMRRLLIFLLLTIPTFATTDKRVYDKPCDAVWAAALDVGKTKYRLLGTIVGEQTLSVSTGSNMTGERIITLALKPDSDRSCAAEAQTRYMWGTGDGRNLLTRIQEDLVGDELGKDTPAFKKFDRCVENGLDSEKKCEAKFRTAMKR
jgi:hypothetical protein